jgi:hypothetical protein
MRRTVVVSMGLLLLIGCGSKRGSGGIVMGKLTYKGQAVNGAMLELYPLAGGNHVSIPVSQEGTFRTSDVPPGEYKIVVKPSEAPTGIPSLKGMSPAKAEEAKQKMAGMQQGKATIPIPNKYKSHLSTTLKQTIVKGEQTVDLILTD